MADHTKPSPSLEDQLSQLQDDVKAIAASLSKLSESKISAARSNAKAQYNSIVKSGQSVADEVTDQMSAYEGQLVEAIRERPLTAVAGAIGVGFLIALLSRR
ncbi:MAG: DNA gyrase subunit B [Devosia sp.]|nr:DNA gyrase subunit B [Devosia sp.]